MWKGVGMEAIILSTFKHDFKKQCEQIMPPKTVVPLPLRPSRALRFFPRPISPITRCSLIASVQPWFLLAHAWGLRVCLNFRSTLWGGSKLSGAWDPSWWKFTRSKSRPLGWFSVFWRIFMGCAITIIYIHIYIYMLSCGLHSLIS